MTIIFYPLGLAVTSSHAEKAETAVSASSLPVSASIAQYGLNIVGPTGPQYIIVSASGLAATPSVSVTPSVSITPSTTPSISVTPSLTPSISVTPSVTPSTTPP